MNTLENPRSNKYDALRLFAIAAVTVIIWNLPFGRYILYPFTIMGTWFHEMGHGIAAIIMGGDFIKLELYANGSGLAVHSANLWFGPLGRAFVAFGGPLGPPFVGLIMLLASRNKKWTKIILSALSLLMLLSAVLWIRTTFGFFIIMLSGALILFLTFKTSDRGRQLILQFLAVQAFLSVYLSIGYLFSSGGFIDQSSFSSDTQVIANNLLLPYWFWASVILTASGAMLVYGIFKSVKQSE